MLPLLPIAEGYPAVQCQFPRRRARRSPSPTPASLANSITAHQRLARCSAKVLPIAASTARGQLPTKTTSAPLHPVIWLAACRLHILTRIHPTAMLILVVIASLFVTEKDTFSNGADVLFPHTQCIVVHPRQMRALLPTKNHEWKKRSPRVQHIEEIYKEVRGSTPTWFVATEHTGKSSLSNQIQALFVWPSQWHSCWIWSSTDICC